MGGRVCTCVQMSYLSPNWFMQLVLSMLKVVCSPLFLLVSQLQEPSNILNMVASPELGKEVDKQALHQELDETDVTAWERDYFQCYQHHFYQVGTLSSQLD